MVAAMVQELILQKKYLTEPVSTIYFGGGTPSLMHSNAIAQVLNTIHANYNVTNTVECTLEANPDDITAQAIIQWKAIGINRLSIGIQSFTDDELTWMNRAHNAAQAIHSVQCAQANGIGNISIDLIYGTPLLTSQAWQQHLHQAVQLGIQHVSCYALTVEPHTALEAMIAKHKKAPLDPNKAATHMELLMALAPTLGLEHYEISNLALPGYRSKHNSNYWQGVPYLGIGPSAHSYNVHSRQWNIANNALYIQALSQGTIPYEVEILTPTQQCNEYIMTAIRTAEGISIATLLQVYNYNVLPAIEVYLTQGLLLIRNNNIILTTQGKLRADGIASALFK